MIDLQKFRNPRSRGICEYEKDYEEYASWSCRLTGLLRRHAQDNSLSSHLSTGGLYIEAASMAFKYIEGSIHVIIHDLTNKGCTWYHLMLLRDLVVREGEDSPVPVEHAGKFYAQISDWLIWYDKKLYG